ncbi:unnamed protein product [Oikopleura dioica]|uniref:BTB domain-containing protein n=1 Tax=Oikopleura dioica TaxID=34765 RepID=E4XDK1_OIKDI|nr:unnamed protein product [Oikopleura dioica]
MSEDNHGFINNNHASEAFQMMDHFLRNKQLCDVTLICGKRRMAAHKLVLSSLSSYFAVMFTQDLCEKNQDEVEIKEVNPDALMWIIRYMYTSHIDIREDNVEDLLITARLLQIEKIVVACCEFLRKQLHPSNCLGIAKFAESQACPELFTASLNFIKKNSLNILNEQEFLELGLKDVLRLLEYDDLVVPNEEAVFDIVTAWVEHDLDARKSSVAELLRAMRLCHISPTYLAENIEPHHLVRENPSAHEIVIDMMKLHLTKKLNPRQEASRKSTLGFLLCIGGMDNQKGINNVELLDPLSPRSWSECGQIVKHKRVQFGSAVIDNKLLVVGGRDGYKTLNSVECYDFATKSWKSMPPLSTHRHGVGIVLLDGPLYAVGGNDGWSFLNTVERWDPQFRSWNFVAPMNTPRSTHGVVAFDSKIFAVGGRDVSSCLRSVECFDPHFNRWTQMANLNKRRGMPGVAVFQECIYAVGGHDTPGAAKPSETTEKYSLEANQWTLISSLHVPREGAGCAVLGDTLYAVGGFDGKKYLKSIEYMRPNTSEDEWIVEGTLEHARSACAVLHVSEKVHFADVSSAENSRNPSTSD